MRVTTKNIFNIFFTCFFIIFSLPNFVSAQNISEDFIEAERILDKINNAEPTKKGQTQREAALEAAKLEAEKMMKSSTSDDKFDNAINIFRGFYLLNVVARPKYCLKYDVNISKFTELFKNKYKNEFKVMSDYDKKHKLSENTTAELFQLLDKAVATEFEMTANQENMSTKTLCKNYKENSNYHANAIDLKTRAPEIYNLLNK